MKNSDAEWLGQVPEHWKVLPNRALFDEVKDRNCPEEEMLSVTIKSGVIRQAALLENSSKKDSSNLDKCKYKLVQPGDVAYNKMRAWQGALGVSEYRGIISPAYVVQRPRKDCFPKYFHNLFRTPAFAKEAERWSYGITSDMWSLRPEHFKLIYSCLPPPDEQAAIVRYLGYVDRRVRRLVRAKQKLIKLVEEQKQAIINRAVTRGLEPNVRLKPSGVEWLGDVPEHWEVCALRFKYDQCLGKMLDAKRITGKDSLPYLRNTDVQWDRINVVNLPVMDIPITEYPRYTVRPDDLLVCEGGEVGRAAIWRGELDICGFQKALHRLRPFHKNRQFPRFMYFVLNAASKSKAFSDGHVSTISHLTGDKLRAHRFAFPPFSEQMDIVKYVDRKSAEIERTICRARSECGHLAEYSARLIADVVTGKLDVQGAVKSLPSEPDDHESMDELDLDGDELDVECPESEDEPGEVEA